MHIYQQTNNFLEKCFHELESGLPKAKLIDLGDSKALRYSDETLEIAIIQKLARYVSGLNASLLLLDHSYTQEIGALFRTLDEFQEDISFLALPLTTDHEVTKTHERYLQHFFQEEFDNPNNAILSTQKREMIPRQKIRSVLANSGVLGMNPSDSIELSRTISQVYSGYVHGASCHICEMIGDEPLRYHLKGSDRQYEFSYNYWDYAFRGLVSMVVSAKALGNVSVAQECREYLEYFEKVTNDTGKGDPEKMMKKVKKKNA